MSTETRHTLQTELQSVRLASRQLSRAIGEAKQAGSNVTTLVEQKKRFSTRERELMSLISEAIYSPSTGLQGAATIAADTVHHEHDAASDVPSDTDDLEATEVELASTTDWPAWDEFVKHQPGASVYHLSGWRTVIQKSFGHDCPYLIAKRSDRVVGVLPLVRMQSRLFGHFMVSVPYFNYGGALAADKQAKAALLAQASAMTLTNHCNHLELRGTEPLPDWPARSEKVSMWLRLPANADQLWQFLGSKLRAQIKKTHAKGLQYETGGIELLDEFYRVFSINMRDLGTPVYAKTFFAHVVNLAPGQITLVIGRDSCARPVSAALLVLHQGRMEVPWASTLRRANELNANMGLYWHMLQYACQQGCHTFDFGRSTQGASTYRFKKQWGAEPVQLQWHYWLAGGGDLPKLNPDNPKYRAAIAVWQKLPVWATRLLGPMIVRNIP